ncbi:unnamed protein product [Paramecium octaurelia]|uniref:Uncharacterized protein n=1 Tax=Paramecium octaurelia TaxID=43137 RepID=A0A8S1SK28_PAROT|nr:unnamed protein product [Paramecium octaurelia]
MSEEEYSQFLFEKHDLNKFNRYEELNDFKGFRLPDDKNKTIYLLDQDGGWCDLNGCYYNQDGQPSGWIILNKDGKKFMRFNLSTEFIEEQENIYYSNQSFDATKQEQNQQKHNNNNQRPKQENRKKYNQSNQSNQNPQKKQYQHKQKDQDGEKTNNQANLEKTKEQQEDEEEELYVQKKDQQQPNRVNNTSDNSKNNDRDGNQRNQRDRKYNNKNQKNQKKNDQNQDNNEIKKYYILNINDNTLNKEDFVKYLIEECKIKQENIIDYDEKILKLAQDKDAIKLYRLNKKQQTDQVQKFIVST